jgi:cell division topological specificity factor
MNLFDLFKRKEDKETSAEKAKNRLRLILEHTHSRGGHDYLPDLRRDIIAAISKYVPGFDPEAVTVDVHRDGTQDVLDITVSLPES